LDLEKGLAMLEKARQADRFEDDLREPSEEGDLQRGSDGGESVPRQWP
jgi:hypothetical protein